MRKLWTQRIGNCRGFTIVEVIIAALITGIVATAGFRFYVSMHNQTEAQYEVSEIQNLCRASLYDIKKSLRMAGFRLTGHDAFAINGDSLTTYFSETQPVDSVLYYLEEFSDSEYGRVPVLPDGMKLYKLMKQQNSGTAAICTDFISDIEFEQLDRKTVVITVTAQASRPDDTFHENNGYRTWSLSERVCIRNVS